MLSRPTGSIYNVRRSMHTLAYSERLIAFVDVLGFGPLIEQSSESPARASEIIKRVSDAILWSIEELEEMMHALYYPKFTHFSDSFVVSIASDIPKAGRMNLFAFSLLNIIHCFLGSELFLRGGITRGMVVHNDRLLFGPAINRAYELESGLAKNPRIILDPNIPDLQDFLEPAVIGVDADGLRYIDYFAKQQMFFLVPGRWLCIQRAIEAIPMTLRLQEKRGWLVEKYNAAIAGFSYAAFKARLDDYVYSTENNAVDADYRKFLSDAEQIRKL